MHAAQRAFQDTLISPAKLHNDRQNELIATPASAPLDLSPTDSQRRITLTGPPISTQDIFDGVPPFAFNAVQKSQHTIEISTDTTLEQLAVLDGLGSGNGKTVGGPTSQNPSFKSQGFGGSFNLNDTIEEMSVYLTEDS